jgi:hypothetical protein
MEHSRTWIVIERSGSFMRTLISNAIKYLDQEQRLEIPADAGSSISCDASDTMIPGCVSTRHSRINLNKYFNLSTNIR